MNFLFVLDGIRSELHQNWWLAVMAVALAGTIPTAYVLAPPTEVGFTGWVGVFGTVNSLAISLILAYLYREMSETQDKQTELMENQQRLLQREQEPVVEIRNLSIEQDENGTQIAVEVANKGASPIRELLLGIDLVLYGETDAKLGMSTENPVVHEGDEWIIEPLDVAFQREGVPDDTGGTHLESGELATLVAPVVFRRRNRETERVASSSFRGLMAVLRETRIRTVKIHASLLYTGLDGRPRGQRLESGKADLTTFETLEELFASERTHTKLPSEFLTARQRHSTRWVE